MLGERTSATVCLKDRLMRGPFRLIYIAAHPDDETLGVSGTLAKYSREGVETFVVTATRGEAGRHGLSAERPPAETIGISLQQ